MMPADCCLASNKSSPASLVVVADDFGISKSRNQGIIQALKHGVVTRASLIVNGTAVEEAVELAKQEGFVSVLGLHLNLSEGIPVSCDKVPTLTKGGLMLGKQRFREAVARGEIVADDIRTEAEAQLDKFRSLVGCYPSRVDGHQHCHVLPGVREPLAEVFARKGVQFTRIPNENAAGALCRVCAVVSQEAARAQALYRSKGIASAGCLVGLRFCASPYSPQELATAVHTQIELTRSHSCEVMVHPGQQGELPGWDAFDCSSHRVGELEALCDPMLPQLLAKGAQLVTEITPKL